MPASSPIFEGFEKSPLSYTNDYDPYTGEPLDASKQIAIENAKNALDAIMQQKQIKQGPARTSAPSLKGYEPENEEATWSHTTLADVLARLRQLESIVSTLLLVNNLKVPTQSVEEVKKDGLG